MILERLKLRNFRSYLDAEVAFEPGVTLFEGDIGSGKSSLLFAVEFALFGLADVPGEHLLRAGEKEGVIELQFRSKGQQYTVGRRLTRSKAGGATQKDAFLVVDGVKDDYSVEQLRAAVIKVLGFRENAATKSKSQVFRYGVFTPQEEMKAILEGGAEERRQTLRRAFGIEEYKRARENADMVKQALRERAAALEAVLAGVPRLEEERALAERERDGLEALVKVTESQQAGAVAERKEAEAKLREGEALESRDREAERARAGIEVERTKQAERKSAAERLLEELSALEPQVAPLKEVAATLPRIEAELSAAEAKEEGRRKLEQELARVETRIKSLDARRLEIAQDAEDLRAVTDRADEIHAGKRALDEAKAALDRVREEAAAAREAGEQAASLKRRMATLEKEAGAEGDLGARLKDREEAARAGVAAATELFRLEERVRSAQEAQGAARTLLTRTEADLEEITSLQGKARCPKCQQPLTESHLSQHRQELEEQAKGARTKLGQAQAHARALDKKRGTLEKAREAGERASRESATIAAELKRAHQAAEDSKAAAKELAGVEKAALRFAELAKRRKELEHEVASKAAFEGRAAELEAATKRARDVSDQYRKVMKETEDTAKAVREIREKRGEVGDDAAQLKRLREALSAAKVKAGKLQDLERRLHTRADLERQREEAEAEHAALARRAAEQAAIREELARKLKESPVNARRSRFDSAADKAATLGERLKRAREELLDRESRLSRAAASLEEASASREKLGQVRHTRDFIEQCFQVALEDVELKVLADLNGQLNDRFQAYFGRLMEGAPVEVEIDPEFEPTVTQGPNALPLAALSGGERTSIALAYRLALNMLVSRAAGMESPDLLILDEPTDGFSKEQLSRVGELLRDLDCEQVVLVSHERELESCADQVFEVIKDGTVSRIEAR